MVSHPYSVGSEEPTDNRTLHSFAYVLPDVTPEHSLAFEVLTHALLTSPAAPLKQAW